MAGDHEEDGFATIFLGDAQILVFEGELEGDLQVLGAAGATGEVDTLVTFCNYLLPVTLYLVCTQLGAPVKHE